MSVEGESGRQIITAPRCTAQRKQTLEKHSMEAVVRLSDGMLQAVYNMLLRWSREMWFRTQLREPAQAKIKTRQFGKRLSEDGGKYLVHARGLATPSAGEAMPWSTELLLRAPRQRKYAIKVTARLLPSCGSAVTVLYVLDCLIRGENCSSRYVHQRPPNEGD